MDTEPGTNQDKEQDVVDIEEEDKSSQTGPTSTASHSPPSEEETHSPTMGYSQVPSGQQAFDDFDPAEVDAEGAAPTIEDNDNEDVQQQGLQVLESGLTYNLTQTQEEEAPKVKPLSTIIEDDDRDEDGNLSPDDGVANTNGKKRGDRGGGGPQYVKPTKVVLRMLPPLLTKSEFIESVSPLPEYDYVMVDNPDPEWGINGRTVAHINFLDYEDAVWFIDRFTGYEFFDDNGESYIGVGDFAMSQKVFRPGGKKGNPDRGKLLEKEDYKVFVEKYNENPFQFEVGQELPEIMTAEAMLADIEDKRGKKGPESTPLTEFILNKKSRKEAERKLRREKERERHKLEKIKREKEREKKEAERELKNEKRREKRDKERKERRGAEKLEKEAKAKGITVTYSKTGGVTRWSANSTPFKKGKDDAPDTEVDKGQSSDSNVPCSSTTKDKPTSSSSSKADEPVKRKPTNPFSKDIKKFDKPRDEKPKFGKPFPIKETEPLSSDPKGDKKEKDSADSTATTVSGGTDKPKGFAGKPFKTQDNGGDSKEGDSSEKGKKKIVKKIIRVKKVKPKNGGEEGETPAVVETTLISKKVVSSSSKSEVKIPSKSSTSSSSAKPPPSSTRNERKTEDETEDGTKRRRARPDMQIYRPGSLRSSAKEKPKPQDKGKEKEKAANNNGSSSTCSTTTSTTTPKSSEAPEAKT